MKSCRSSQSLLLKKWILCLSLFSGLHQTAAAVYDDQLIISLESYQLTLLGLPQEILLDHNFKKEIDVVMYLAIQQLGHERIATVIQILSVDYGSPIDNLTTFIQAALKKFTLLPTERNQLLFSLLFMTALLKQHAYVPLTRNLSVMEFHHEFHAAATTVQHELQTTAEQLKQFLPLPPRKSWLKKALSYSIIGAAAFAVWWFLTRSSREKPRDHEKREAVLEALPELVDVPALVADIVDRLRDVEHGIAADFDRVRTAHNELVAATHAEVEHGIAASRHYTDGAVADARGGLSAQLAQLQVLQERFTADLPRLTTAEAVERTAAIEILRRELATERGAREGAIVAETRDRIAAIEAERARNDNARAEERRRVDTGLGEAIAAIQVRNDERAHAAEVRIAAHEQSLAAMLDRIATVERLARTTQANLIPFQAVCAAEREAYNEGKLRNAGIVNGAVGAVRAVARAAVVGGAALAGMACPEVVLPVIGVIGHDGVRAVVDAADAAAAVVGGGAAGLINGKFNRPKPDIRPFDPNLAPLAVAPGA